MELDNEKPFVQTSSTGERIRQRSSTLLVALATALLLSFTIFFAYNSSLQQPYLSLFVSKHPSRSVLILNIASHLTLFCLADLMATVLESVRWTLACHGTGTPALTFLTLSRATGFVGSLFLSFGKSKVRGAFPTNDHRVWGLQRYSHPLCNMLNSDPV
jgi:hypothetical protein